MNANSFGLGYAAQARPKQHIFWLIMAFYAIKSAIYAIKFVVLWLINRGDAIINAVYGLIFYVYECINIVH